MADPAAPGQTVPAGQQHTMASLRGVIAGHKEAAIAEAKQSRINLLSDLFYALRDRGQFTTVGAGFQPPSESPEGPKRKRRRLAAAADGGAPDSEEAELAAFVHKYTNDVTALKSLDMSLPVEPTPLAADSADLRADASTSRLVSSPPSPMRSLDTPLLAPPVGISPSALLLNPNLSPAPFTRMPSASILVPDGPFSNPDFPLHEQIPHVHNDYASAYLPPVPEEVLRNRLTNAPMAPKRHNRNSKERVSTGAWTGGMDLHRMYVRAQHMGAKNFLGRGRRVTNYLSSQDWSTALEEVRSIRAFERIEQLKAEHKWSFRQMKKQKVGISPKAHWDYVLDEMRWLQADVRQERRCKVTAAHLLCRAAKAWHDAAGDPEKRARLCVPAGRKGPREVPMEAAAIEDAAEAAEAAPVVVEDEPSEVQPKIEAQDEMNVEGEEDAEGEEDGDGEASAAPTTKEGGEVGEGGVANPTPIPTPGAAGRPPTEQLTKAQLQQQAAVKYHRNMALRAPVFDLGVDAISIDPSVLYGGMEQSPALHLAELFQECHPYSWPPIPSDMRPNGVQPDPRTDQKAEKRVEESSSWSSRLTQVTRLLQTKPLLVSTLQPAKMQKSKDKWGNMATIMLEEPPYEREMPSANSALFVGRKSRDSPGQHLAGPQPVPNAADRAASLVWSSEEDAMLQVYGQRYSNNWHLMADIFNASTTRPSSDQRLPWDIFDRWMKLYGPKDGEEGAPTDNGEGTSAAGAASQMSTRGTQAKAAQQNVAANGPFANFEGSKKRLRHLSIFDAMKKTQRKREMAAHARPPPGPPRRVNMATHETHNLPRIPMSPIEIGRHAERERDRKIQQQVLLQQQALAQKLQAQQQRFAASPGAAQAFQQAQGGRQSPHPRMPQPNGTPNGGNAVLPSPPIPGQPMPNGGPTPGHFNIGSPAGAIVHGPPGPGTPPANQQALQDQLAVYHARQQQAQLAQMQIQMQANVSAAGTPSQ